MTYVQIYDNWKWIIFREHQYIPRIKLNDNASLKFGPEPNAKKPKQIDPGVDVYTLNFASLLAQVQVLNAKCTKNVQKMTNLETTLRHLISPVLNVHILSDFWVNTAYNRIKTHLAQAGTKSCLQFNDLYIPG